MTHPIVYKDYMSNLNYTPELLHILCTEFCNFNVKLKACGGANGQKQLF